MMEIETYFNKKSWILTIDLNHLLNSTATDGNQYTTQIYIIDRLKLTFIFINI